MKIKLDPGAYIPVRAHAADAGLDLKAKEGGVVPPHDRVTVRTGVHIQLPAGTVGFVKTRSSYLIGYGVTTDGTIDEGFTGDIRVVLFNHSGKPFSFEAGERIAQLVIVPCMTPELELMDRMGETERGDSGYGSTGR